MICLELGLEIDLILIFRSGAYGIRTLGIKRNGHCAQILLRMCCEILFSRGSAVRESNPRTTLIAFRSPVRLDTHCGHCKYARQADNILCAR
jgi:hypothetical protein